MLKRSFFIGLFFLPAIYLQAQFDTSFAKAGIRRCADSLAYGFKTKDWQLFARYSNPGMIGSMGGTDAFMEYISQAFAQIPDSAVKKYAPGKILQIIKTPGELQCIIELDAVIEVQGKRITGTSYLVGQSWDGGLFWTFFDSQNDVNAAKTIKPDLSDLLVIPPKKEKVEPITPAKKTPKAKAKGK